MKPQTVVGVCTNLWPYGLDKFSTRNIHRGRKDDQGVIQNTYHGDQIVILKLHTELFYWYTIYIIIWYGYFILLLLCLLNSMHNISPTNFSIKRSSPTLFHVFSNLQRFFPIARILHSLSTFLLRAKSVNCMGSIYYWHNHFYLIYWSFTTPFPIMTMCDIRQIMQEFSM